MTGILINVQIIGVMAMFGYIIYIVSTNKAGAYSILTAALAASFLNAFSYTMILFSENLDVMRALKPFDIMGSSLALYLIYMFIRDTKKVNIPKYVSYILLIADMFGILAAATDRRFHLYYRSITASDPNDISTMEATFSAGFYVLLASMAVKTAFIVGIAAKGYLRRKDGGPREVLLPYFTVILPVLTMAAYGFRAFGYYNPSSLAICVCCAAITFAVYHGNTSDMVNIARDGVIEAMDDALIITDNKMNIIDSNPAARALFPALSEGGKHSAHFAAELAADDSSDEFEIDGKCYEKHIKCLYNSDGSEAGRAMLVIDVTDTKRYVNDLIEMRKKADSANVAKSDFLANMSHEIRTPLNAITGFAELCLQEKNHVYATDIKKAAKSLLSIVNDILDISKIEAGKLELVKSTYDTESMLDDVISIVNGQLSEKEGIEFKIEIDSRLPKKMYGDEVRLKQILINLLGNAVKFTKKGSIGLSVKELSREKEDISLMFKVSDTGIGIKKEDISKLFEDFQQLDTRRNREIEGSGLGLSISKTFAAMMNGNITVDSEYGKGSVFTVVLIQKIVDPSPISVSAARNSANEEKKLMPYIPEARVLVVDDNKVNLDVTARLLNMYGIKADIADSGMAAIQMINSAYYDLVFMDHMMPEMDGVDTTHMIRSQGDAYSKELPIIALTANAVSGAREMLLEAGLNDFIPKPIQMPALEKILETWLPEKMIRYVDRDKKPAVSNSVTTFDILGITPSEEEAPAVGEQAETFITIPNVNVAMGLDRCGGSAETYLAVLKTFMETAYESISRIENYAESRDYKNYATEVHGLKSSALAIGAESLSAMAKQLELAGRSQDYKTIQSDTPMLIARFSELAEDIKPFVETNKSGGSKPPVDRATLRAKLNAVLAAIDELDSHGAMEILDELAEHCCENEEISREIENSRRYADNFAYEKAEAAVRRILEMI